MSSLCDSVNVNVGASVFLMSLDAILGQWGSPEADSGGTVRGEGCREGRWYQIEIRAV